ncbi:MAG TPA: DoxX family protein [Spirochaetia bacterium]|nr:DoxX family protein [Spirochaetia bacterium]
MSAALWIVQGVLGVFYLAVGGWKAVMPEDVQKRMPWAAHRTVGFVKLVGTAEVLGSLGVVLPTLTGILPILTPLAAAGLAVIQVLAVITVHLPRKELRALPLNALLLGLAIFVAVGRWALA